jgi:hypothetical protein
MARVAETALGIPGPGGALFPASPPGFHRRPLDHPWAETHPPNTSINVYLVDSPRLAPGVLALDPHLLFCRGCLLLILLILLTQPAVPPQHYWSLPDLSSLPSYRTCRTLPYLPYLAARRSSSGKVSCISGCIRTLAHLLSGVSAAYPRARTFERANAIV